MRRLRAGTGKRGGARPPRDRCRANALRADATPVLVEGPLDVAAVNTAGDGRFVGIAALGTALTGEHVEALSRVIDLREREIAVGFDGDIAGNAAGARAYEHLAPRTDSALRLALPAGQDPADVLGRDGPPSLRAMLDSTVPLVQQVIDARIQRWDDRPQWPEGRLGALRDVAGLVAALPPEQVAHHVVRLMRRLDLPRETVSEAVLRALPGVLDARSQPDVSAARPPRHTSLDDPRAGAETSTTSYELPPVAERITRRPLARDRPVDARQERPRSSRRGGAERASRSSPGRQHRREPAAVLDCCRTVGGTATDSATVGGRSGVGRGEPERAVSRR